jgi:hypothetical protein
MATFIDRLDCTFILHLFGEIGFAVVTVNNSTSR